MARRTRTLTATALAAAALLLTACGDDGEAEPSDTVPSDTVPITVEQLVERSSDTAIPVVGFLHISGGSTRLCALILESYPPQCGEPSVELVGIVPEDVPGLQSEGSVQWREQLELVVQRNPDATFTVLDVRT
ncbi:MAG: hypothetical protein MUE78_03085 [Ilumatobacteraceae bacterium]|jgi:hypothetical protein|nr:hypothetical protein [Ilumatobacteraceae bacterium]